MSNTPIKPRPAPISRYSILLTQVIGLVAGGLLIATGVLVIVIERPDKFFIFMGVLGIGTGIVLIALVNLAAQIAQAVHDIWKVMARLR